jgi:lipoprotein signal peptidase
MDTSLNNPSQTTRVRFAWRAGYLLAALGVYFADQASKAWAVKTLRFLDERVVVPGLVKFYYTENPGIAFGQLQEGGSPSFTIFSALPAPTIACLALAHSCSRESPAT